MSDIDLLVNAADAACCVNSGCGNRFDPAREGFNGECDCCAALAVDHFTGMHQGPQLDCPFCWADVPIRLDRSPALAA
jgi:hypothetical protein